MDPGTRAGGDREGVGTKGPRLSQQRSTVSLWGQSLRPFLAVFPDCLNLSDLLAVVQLSLQADLSIRLDICRQVSGK